MEQKSGRVAAVAAGPRAGEMLPYFELPSARGEPIGPRRYKGRRNLVLVFLHNDDCDLCRDILGSFAEHYGEYVEEEAEVLGIVAAGQRAARQLAEQMKLPFPLLADEDGSVHRDYGAVATPTTSGLAVYVADRYGEVQARWFDDIQHHRLPPHAEVLENLRFIGIQCPE